MLFFSGSLYDVTGNYDVSFYVAGITITLAGLINLPLRRLARKLNKNQNAAAASRRGDVLGRSHIEADQSKSRRQPPGITESWDRESNV